MPTLEAETPLAQTIQERSTQGEAKSIKDFMRGRSDTYKLNPFDIEIEPGFNVRDVNSQTTLEHIDNLAQSITEIGLQRALKVRMKGNRPVLVDGECRLRAVKRAIEHYGAEIVAIDCRLADKTMSDADATLSLVVENSGSPLNALEKSEVFKRLVAYGWPLNEIAKKAGLSSVRITQLIQLTGVPEPLKEMIRKGEIAPTQAWQIADDEDYDCDRIMERIKAARVFAEAKGRKKVTARHFKAAKPSMKTSLSGILAGCSVEDIGDDGFVVVFSREQFEQLQELTKVRFDIHSGAE